MNPHTLLVLLENLLVVNGIEKCALCKRISLSTSFSSADLIRLGIDASKVTPCTV